MKKGDFYEINKPENNCLIRIEKIDDVYVYFNRGPYLPVNKLEKAIFLIISIKQRGKNEKP